MYKLMITTLDSNNEGFEIASDFETMEMAFDWMDWNQDEYLEMVTFWIEPQTIVDEFGAEAAANVMGVGDEFDDDYLLDNGTHL